MNRGPQAGGRVEGAGRDRDVLSAASAPEHARSALPAEAALAAVGDVPAQAALGRERERAERRLGVRADVAMGAAAAAAVADLDITQWPGDAIADRAAETAAGGPALGGLLDPVSIAAASSAPLERPLDTGAV